MSFANALSATVVCNRQTTPFLEAAGEYSLKSFDLREHHELVSSKAYLCFVPLLSTYALLPAARFIDPNYHVLDLIPDHVSAAASEGRCHLVLDAGSEGDPLVTASFDHLHNWLHNKGISRQTVTYISQNRKLAASYTQNYGDNGPRFFSYDYYVKRMMSSISLDDAGFERETGARRQDLPVPGLRHAPYAFLCINGTPRHNRVLVIAALLSKGLLADCYWSLLGAASNKMNTVAADVKAYRNAFGASWVTDEAIEAVIHAMPRIFPDEQQQIGTIRDANQLANSINAKSFQQGAISIVTETDFSVGDVQRVTEKTVKPICVGHPTIVAGNPGAMSLVRELGFQTFCDIIDESYDTILHPADRLLSIVETAQAMRGITEPNRRNQIDEVCRFNARYARESAARDYEARVEKPIVRAFAATIAALFPRP